MLVLTHGASQRTRIDVGGASSASPTYWLYSYEALGQVTFGKKYWADSTPVSGQQFEYLFDDIGNRKLTKAGGDASGANLRPANYLANPLNQYVFRTVPGVMDIIGQARTNATVTVNLQPTARKGEYYHRPLALNNRAGAVWQVVTNLAVLNNGTNADILSSNVGSIFLPQTPEVYAHDADGNLTRDGHWTLTWNAENRLAAVETVPTAVSTGVPKEKLEFTYDHQGRRVQKKVYAWDTDHWSLTSDSRFLYDGWNLIAVVDSQSSLLKSFTWGLDLSGSLQGAGGVGGLLAVTIHDSQVTTHFAAYDGNGNVMALVNAADGTESARYEYGPFGEVIRATGPMAKANPFRFSTKYQDEETGWNYYGYRFFDSSVGRWVSRDPIGERGGLFLYAFLGNASLSRIDVLGLATYTVTGPAMWAKSTGLPTLDVGYPRLGPVACCRSRKVGEIQVKYLIIDAHPQEKLIGNHDKIPDSSKTYDDVYQEIDAGFPLSNKAKVISQLSGTVGGGIVLNFRRTREGKICCPAFVWRNTLLPNTFDGEFFSNMFADVPQLEPPGGSGTFSRNYYLELFCIRAGVRTKLWSANWGYSAAWVFSPPQSSVSVTLAVPW